MPPIKAMNPTKGGRETRSLLERIGRGFVFLSRPSQVIAGVRQTGEGAGEGLMPPGERSTTWFPELVIALRESWRPGVTCDALVGLRDQLQRKLEEILKSRAIIPARVRCLHCGHVGPGAPPVLSVRAVILALRRFGVESDDTVRRLDKAWTKHRALQQLDLYGRPAVRTETAPVDVGRDHVHAEERR